ncbi:MAG: o-succinylbenzoate synthase, partial [Plesiomonas sp.]
MKTAALYRYSLPMEAGIGLRNRPLKTREGLIIHLQQGDKQGWGEIAPLPYFSEETLEQAQVDVLCWLTRWQAGEQPEEPQWPSVAFGVSCAEAELSGELPVQGDF